MPKLNVLDLFSGIGGFSLGLERATLEGAYIDGFTTTACCEIEAFPRKVLAKHWPDVPCYDDVRTLTAERLAADGIAVDVICGGFPCQDISFAGKGAGLAGERSGLFYEVARLVGELAPRFVILENVGALLSRGLDAVLGTLASLGYDAEWHCIPASYLGAPHRRDRVWIIAYTTGAGRAAGCGAGNQNGNAVEVCAIGLGAKPCRGCAAIGEGLLADANSTLQHNEHGGCINPTGSATGNAIKSGGSCDLADAERQRQQGQRQPILSFGAAQGADWQAAWPLASGLGDIWRTEPDVGRVANGVPDRAHRLKGLGNAVVPQIPELIGRAILAALQDSRTARPSRACAAGEAFDPRVSPNPLQNVSHDAPYTGDRA